MGDWRLRFEIRVSQVAWGKTAPIITILAAEGKNRSKTECPPLTHAQPADHHDDDDTQNPYRHLRRKLDEKQPPTGGAEVRALGILILIESLGTKRTTKSMTHAGQKSWGREKGDSCHLPQRPEGGHHPCMVVARMVPATFFPSTSLVKRGILPK